MSKRVKVGSTFESVIHDIHGDGVLSPEPMWLDDDPLIVDNRSMRIFRIVNLSKVKAVKLERWKCRVARYSIDTDPSHQTKDGRTKVYIYIELLHRVIRTESVYFEYRNEVRKTTWCGHVVAGSETLKASHEEFTHVLPDGMIVKGKAVFFEDELLCVSGVSQISKNDYIRRMQEKIGKHFRPESGKKAVAKITALPQELQELMAA